VLIPPENGDGAGRLDREKPAGHTGPVHTGPVERLRDAITPGKLTSSIVANTGTILVTAVAGIVVAEFGHGWLPGLLTLAVAVVTGVMAGLVTFYLPDPKRRARSRPQHASEAAGSPGHQLLGRVRAAGAILIGLGGLAGASYGVVRMFARGPLTGAVSLLVAAILLVCAPLLWRRRQSWPKWLRRLHPGQLLRLLCRKNSREDQDPDGSDRVTGSVICPRARLVLACVLAPAAVMTGAELGFSVHVAACPGPAELRILAAPEVLPAIQASITPFEENEPEYVGSACFAVQLTAYAPEDAPDAALLRDDFESGWDQAALEDIGPEPDIWIPDSTDEVDAVSSGMPLGGPTFSRLGPIGYSPLVVAVPEKLVTSDSLAGLESGQSWANLYNDFSQMRPSIKLAMPDPNVSETGLFEITDLYDAITPQDEHDIEASGNFPQDSQDLLCDATQTAGQSPDTAYLVSEVAMADYDRGLVDPTEDPCPTPSQLRPGMQAFYPAGTSTLNFPFTMVNWGGNQDARQSRYEEDFYKFLVSPAGVSAIESQGLRPLDCRTGGTITQADGVADFAPSCESPLTPSATKTNSALNAFNQAVPNASVLIGIDDSEPMKRHLAQITAAIDAVLSPRNAPPLGAGDHFGIWELPGTGGATDTPLVPFEPVTTANLHRVASPLTRVEAHQHSADYNMMTDASKVLYAQQPVWPGNGSPPVNSVLLLTDGDGYSGDDPGPADGTAASVQALFSSPPPGRSPIALYIIAFGPAGCTPTMLNLTDATHGTCYPADGGDPGQLLGQALDQLSGGG
jgi:Bacterial extracellular solute-binding protein